MFFVRRDRTWIDAADLVVAADHRVELALPGLLGQVAAVPLERLVLLLGVLVGDALPAAHLGERRSTPSRVSPASFRIRDAPESTSSSASSRCSVETYSSVSASRLRDRPGRAPRRSRRDPHVGRLPLRVHLGHPVERLVDLVAQRLRRHAELVQQRIDHALGVGEQREQQVLRLDRLVVPRRAC